MFFSCQWILVLVAFSCHVSIAKLHHPADTRKSFILFYRESCGLRFTYCRHLAVMLLAVSSTTPFESQP